MQCASDVEFSFRFGEIRKFELNGHVVTMQVSKNNLLVFETNSGLPHLDLCIRHQSGYGMRICYDNRLAFHEGRSSLSLKIEPGTECLLTLKNP